ncbi:MAG: DUF2917 domain-containing protein [Comamonadaceae bacterium]|nr:DUF2917 domain-containing protein [Comamonadaceae bacterium]
MDTTAAPDRPRPGADAAARAAGRRLRVLQGRLWLTASGCADDVVVDAGAELALPGGGRGALVVEALDGPARAELLAAHAPPRRAARTPDAAPAISSRPPPPGR